MEKSAYAKLGIDKGVLVNRVERGPAAKAGIRSGDVILMVNNQEIKNSIEFAELAKDLPKDKIVPVLVQRGNAPMFLALNIA